MLRNKTHLILDMNGTFMFGHDRFAKDEDFYPAYRQANGKLPATRVNRLIRAAYDYLEQCYSDPAYRECFPSVAFAIQRCASALGEDQLSAIEMKRLLDVFSRHELGDIPPAYRASLKKLREKFSLALFIDIWAPKQQWTRRFDDYELTSLFSAMSFSSDLGLVKPSPLALEKLIADLGIEKSKCIVIGDSAQRDLGAATAAQVDCILVGEQNHKQAVAHFENLLAFTNYLE